jgi:hypothetical protein
MPVRRARRVKPRAGSELHNLLREVFKEVVNDPEVIEKVVEKSRDMVPTILNDEEIMDMVAKKSKDIIPRILNDREIIEFITRKGVKVLLRRKELLGGVVTGLLEKTKGILGGLLGEEEE